MPLYELDKFAENLLSRQISTLSGVAQVSVQGAAAYAVRLQMDPTALAAFPNGYRHLAYIQTQIGYTVKRDMPQLVGAEVDALYARGRAWLAGAAVSG